MPQWLFLQCRKFIKRLEKLSKDHLTNLETLYRRRLRKGKSLQSDFLAAFFSLLIMRGFCLVGAVDETTKARYNTSPEKKSVYKNMNSILIAMLSKASLEDSDFNEPSSQAYSKYRHQLHLALHRLLHRVVSLL